MVKPKVPTIIIRTCEASGMNMPYKACNYQNQVLCDAPSHCVEVIDERAQIATAGSSGWRGPDRGGREVLQPAGAAAAPQAGETPSRHRPDPGR
jgi:hypothetical protein